MSCVWINNADAAKHGVTSLNIGGSGMGIIVTTKPVMQDSMFAWAQQFEILMPIVLAISVLMMDVLIL